nr:unnamed protein product [Callosobruchus analis]
MRQEKRAKVHRLRFGHTALTHLILLLGNDPPLCQRCGADLVVRHLLCECPMLASLRRTFDLPDDLKTCLNDLHSIERVLSYLRLNGNSYPASFTYTPGGVGRNICEALIRLGVTPAYFATAVGSDDPGRLLLAKGGGATGLGGKLGGISDPIRVAEQDKDDSSSGDSKMASWSKVKGIKVLDEMRTAECVIVFDEDRESRIIMADWDIHKQISKDMVKQMEDEIKNCPLLIIDGNIPVDTMEEAMKISLKHDVPGVLARRPA